MRSGIAPSMKAGSMREGNSCGRFLADVLAGLLGFCREAGRMQARVRYVASRGATS